MNGQTLDVPGAGAMMNVHVKTVLDLINDGTLPAGRVGRAYVLLTKDVMAHIERVIIQQTAARMGGEPLRRQKRRPSRAPSGPHDTR